MLVVFFLFTGFRGIITPKIKRNDFKSAVCKIGDLESFVTASGLVTPENKFIITSPFSSKILDSYKKPGEKVNTDDVILRLEDIKIKNDLFQEESKYNLLIASKTKMILQNLENILALESAILIEEKNMESQNIIIADARHLFNLGMGSESTLKKLQLDNEIKGLQLNRSKSRLQSCILIQDSALKELEIEILKQKQLVNDLKIQQSKTTLKSGHNGVLSWINDRRGESIYQGDHLATILDLSSFKIICSISEIHGDKLELGKEVIIKIDVTELVGNISAIEPAVTNHSVFFQVQLQEGYNSPLLRPDLNVAVQIPSEIFENVSFLPLGYELKGLGMKKVFVIKDGKAMEREIMIGSRNSDFVIIEKGLFEGEEIILSNMDKYKASEILIKE